VLSKPLGLIRRGLSDPADLRATITSRLRSLWPHDSFPSFHSVRHRGTRVLINDAALSFWTSAARRDPAFEPIYSGHQIDRPIPPAIDAAPSVPPPVSSRNSPTSTATGRHSAVDRLVDSAQEYGFGLLEDFLPDSKAEAVRREFAALPSEPDMIMGTGAALYERTASPEFLALFDDVIRRITARVYGRAMDPPRTTTIDRVQLAGNDTDDPNTILHIDRFLPCVKVFYYPHPITDIDHSPYGFIPGSHIINRRYIESVRESFSELPYRARPFSMRNPTDNAEQAILTGGNSLMLTYTNGLHRRTPFGPTAAQGSFRESAMFMFYDDYTRRDLLSNLFRR